MCQLQNDFIIVAENDKDCDSPSELPEGSSDLNSYAQDYAPHRLRCSTAKSSPVKECGKYFVSAF